MKVLIVGGAGYLGGALTDVLKETSHDVRVYDVLLYEESYRKPVYFIHGDIRDEARLKEELDWADVVVWLAALVGDPACALNEDLTLTVNEQVLHFLKANFEGKIIFMSTCSVYGAADEVLTEESPLKPLSLYAKTKLNAEGILSDANALIFRLGTLYGISDRFSRIRFDLVVNTLVMRASIHGKISVFGGSQYRPLLHVRDVAETIADHLDSTSKGIYNLHSENTTIMDIANKVKKYYPDLIIDSTDTMYQDNRNYKVSSDKAARDLLFNPKLKIEEGIIELRGLLSQGRIKDSFVSRFSNYLYLKPHLEEYASPLGKVVKVNI